MHARHHFARLAVASLAVSAGIASAATPIDQTRPLDARGRVEIENPKGRIEVRAWDRPEVRVEGSLGAGVERLDIGRGGESLRIAVRYPDREGLSRLLGRGARSEPTVLRVTVPMRADLDISAVAADVVAWGVSPSSLSIDNVSGDTTVAAAADDVDINSVSGDVDLTVNRGNVDVENVSGRIRVSGRLGREVSVESVSGPIDVRVLDTSIEKFEGTSVSGDLDVRTALSARARLKLETVRGDVRPRLPRHVSAHVRPARLSRSLRAPGATIDRPEHGPGSSFRQRYGGGDASVSVETFSGDADVATD